MDGAGEAGEAAAAPAAPAAVKKIACIGAGYVGGPSMALLAYKLPHVEVACLDISKPRIQAWNSDDLPVFEPGLLAIIKECRGRNLVFSTDFARHLPDADMIFVW